MGGVGKTQIALEYAHGHLDRYELIAWLRAQEDETLLADFADLGRCLGLAGLEGMPPNDRVRVVHAALAERDDWLLVFDNAEARSAIQSYLPPVGCGHILVTSRDPNWRTFGEPLDIAPFERDESVEFLIERSGDKDPAGADAVAEALGDLPLALEQAGAYVEASNSKLQSYADSFAERHQDLWKDQAPPDAYHETVSTTWSLALDHLKKESPASVDLMQLIAFLEADDIPLSLLVEGGEELPKRLRKAVTDEVALGRAVAALRSHSLVTKEDDAISVHRLVQLVVRDALKAKEQAKWIEICLAVLKIGHDFRQDDPKTWRKCERLLSHVVAVVAHAEQAGLAQETTSYLLDNAACYLQTIPNLPLAREYHEHALTIAEKLHGPDHPSVAKYSTSLGAVLQQMGQFDSAKTAFLKALRIAETASGMEHASIAVAANNLGGILQELGDFCGAQAAFERAANIWEEVHGPNHPGAAIYMNNLGCVLRVRGEYTRARELLERALMIDEAVYGPEHLTISRDLNNLGCVLRELGKLDRAKAAYERALKIRQDTYGLDHPLVAIDMNNLGLVLSLLGDHVGARTTIERALKIAEAALGPNHQDVGTYSNSLGAVLRQLDDYDGAKVILERAVQIDEAVYGTGHPNVASDINSLGCVLLELGDLADAKAAFERALQIDRAAYDPDHPTVARDNNNLGSVFVALNDYVGAKRAFEDALRIYETVLGPDHPSTKTIRKNLELLGERT